MLRKHFVMSGDNKPDFTITYHAPQHVPFFGGYAKNWVYSYPNYGSGLVIDENPIKFKVISDKWDNGVGEWKFKLGDSSNRIYNSTILGTKIDNLGEILSVGLGFADSYGKFITDENGNIAQVVVDNTNIITSVIFGEGIKTINASILVSEDSIQSSCTEITLPESVTLLTGRLFDYYTSLKSITVPLNVIRIDCLCNINNENSLEEVILKPLTPPDASNTFNQNPLGPYYNVKDSLKIRVYADAIDNYKNDSIWSQYSDLYDTINNTIVYYTNDGSRELYTENQDITSINLGTLPQSITNVYLPNSVTSIGSGAFYGCTGLTSVVIGNSVTSIGASAFYNSELTSITIPDSVTSIGASAFEGCTGLTSIEIPNSVTLIGNSAFSYCSGLTSITIPNSVTSIGYDAFKNCTGLTLVVWNAVNCSDFSNSSYNHPFYAIQTQITSFEFGDSVERIPAYMCSGMSNLTSITIPDSVTSIGDSAFFGCSSLTSIVIGNSVTSIGLNAFRDCIVLTLVTITVTTPPKLSAYVFNNTHTDLQIYVPDGSVDAYKTAAYWSSHADKIKPISEKPA